ncbi:MAG: glycosyltransferase family A protein [Phyllobacterium sp.]
MTSVDVAIPNYNYGRFLRSCVESVQKQNVAGLRILIIDNASTDDSAALAREIAAADPRVHLRLRQRNLGAHASFNEAIDWAEADCFTLLCADDYLPAGALARACAALQAHPDANMVFGETLFVQDGDAAAVPAASGAPGGACWSGNRFLQACCATGRSPVSGPTTVVRTHAQKRLGYYRTDLSHTDDMEMWMRFAALGSIVKLDDVQSIVRIHGANQSAVLHNVHHWNVESEAAFEAFFAGHGKSLSDARTLLRTARRSLSDRAYWCAFSHFVRGDPGARDLMAFALKRRPVSAIVPPVGYLWRRPDTAKRLAALFGRPARTPLVQST